MCSALLRGRAALALASVRWTPPATLPPRLQQRRCFAMLAAPTPLLRCSFSWEVPLTIPQLRERLRCQQRDDAPRMQTIETECCLILTLARSPRAEERAEALESGEALWV
ncbi:hypothetical protein DQ04_02031010, partial [Trypanosoma grayi]|uniref:hypothetical protein n=1 Tax=Trypanosoma grayi TaxID=71804 RepID=UPI0004F426EA